MTSTVSCPECEARLRVKSSAAGKKIRCPKCRAVVPVPREVADEESGPAKPRRAVSRKSIEDDEPVPWFRNKKVLIGGGIGAGVLLIGLIVLIVVLAGGNTEDSGGAKGPDDLPKDLSNNPRVTVENFGSINTAMTRAEVEEILGKGQNSNLGQASGFINGLNNGSSQLFTAESLTAGVRSWSVWENGEARIYIGFGNPAAGDRVGLSFYGSRRGAKGYIVNKGAFARQGVDTPYFKDTILNDNRWAKGEQVRKSLIGVWRMGAEGYEFKEDGTLQLGGVMRYKSTFNFLDDEHLEAEIPTWSQPIGSHRTRYRILVDADTLYMVEMRNDAVERIDGPFQRRGRKKG